MMWEYMTLAVGATGVVGAVERMNEAGAEGWELVHIEMGILVFKRPV